MAAQHFGQSVRQQSHCVVPSELPQSFAWQINPRLFTCKLAAYNACFCVKWQPAWHNTCASSE